VESSLGFRSCNGHERRGLHRAGNRVRSAGSFNGQQKPILLVVKKTFVCRLKELSTAIDPVPVGGGFGFSENRGRPLGHLAERCAIYLQPHHILLGYVCDRYSRCDSAWRESNHLFLPKHQTLTVAMVHIGYLKFATERNIVPKGNAVPRSIAPSSPPNRRASASHLVIPPAASGPPRARGRFYWRAWGQLPARRDRALMAHARTYLADTPAENHPR
jgi:hypothetical protein